MRSGSRCPGDRWHLDDVFLKISGRPQYLWRAVDQDGVVLDILVQLRRDKCAAERFLRKLLKALNPKFKSEGPDEPGLRGRVAVSHIHIAHAAHATTHAAAATTALVVLGQFGDHRVGREHQSSD
jgi:DDE domain